MTLDRTFNPTPTGPRNRRPLLNHRTKKSRGSLIAGTATRDQACHQLATLHLLGFSWWQYCCGTLQASILPGSSVVKEGTYLLMIIAGVSELLMGPCARASTSHCAQEKTMLQMVESESHSHSWGRWNMQTVCRGTWFLLGKWGYQEKAYWMLGGKTKTSTTNDNLDTKYYFEHLPSSGSTRSCGF